MKNYELRMTNSELRTAKFFCLVCWLIVSIFSANAQSINQNAPTPITTNAVGGVIPARDLGDARLTTFFYTFEGVQGDVFINVVTTNFNGDIDVFTADKLRPLAKITAYADASNNETGRVIYLRQPVKLILRIQGRTPNDDAATFQMKFAGSFAPSTAIAETDQTPVVKSNNERDVRVNSVGTIIEIKPKPTPAPKAVVAKVEKPIKVGKPQVTPEKIEKSVTDKAEVEKTDAPPKETIAEAEIKEGAAKETPAAVPPKNEETPPAMTNDKIAEKTPEAAAKREVEKAEIKERESDTAAESKNVVKAENKVRARNDKKKSNAIEPVPTAALANINLIIQFKDGAKIQRPMSEILKVGVDKGILTVISKDGTIGRYSILDVEKMTIQ